MDIKTDYKKDSDNVEVDVNDNYEGQNNDFSEEAEGQLAIDVYKTDSEFIIEAPIAGIKKDDIDIAVTADSITIKGRRQHKREVREEDYLYQECFWGRFSRSIFLDQEIDVDGVSAKLRDGVLEVRLPKIQRTRSKKVSVAND